MLRTKTKQPIGTPLAARMRPQKLDEYVGHEQVVGPDTALRRAIESGVVGSLILWGPPGVGKTTLAYLIAEYMEAAVERISAVTAGVAELRAVIARAREWQKINRRTVLIVDEIHRFNKAQQDVLLPVVEEGVVTLIGATTENPYFEVVKALLSRADVVRLELLSDAAIATIVTRAVDNQTGVQPPRQLTATALAYVVKVAGGDARRALNIVERALVATDESLIERPVIEAVVQQPAVQYDKAGDMHYDVISAFIKSMRGSDPDAALFYLFRMLQGGEDPKFIVRRMFIFASEDIGNADPHALMVVAAAADALQWVGLPEAEFALAQGAVYLAAAPKSNSVYVAIQRVKEDVGRAGHLMPPIHLTNVAAKYQGQQPKAESGGQDVEYKYPHDFPGHIVAQQYRPTEVQGNRYYEPGSEGFEREVKRRVERARAVLFNDVQAAAAKDKKK